MKPKNIQAAWELVERYETITLEEIKGNFNSLLLTGFGRKDHCSLCYVVAGKCDHCVYNNTHPIEKFVACCNFKNRKTYFRIHFANTPLKLRNAYRVRAKHIRSILEKL